MNGQISLLLLWMYKLTRQQSNLKLLLTENLQSTFDLTTKQARTGAAQGLNRWSMLEILMYFTLAYILSVQNGPKLKL